MGYSHMVFNVSSQIIFGGLLEMMVGTKHMIIAYFTAGVGGNLLSACMTDRTSVGASTAVFGIFSGHIAAVAVNWYSFNGSPQLQMVRLSLLFFALLMLFINFAMNMNDKSETTDVYGHVGGTISGLLVGLALFKRPVSQYTSNLKVVSMPLLLLFLIGCIVYLFFIRPNAADPYNGIDISVMEEYLE